MVSQGFKFICVRLGVMVLLLITLGFGTLYFLHEVALKGSQLDDSVLQWSLFGACLFLGFVVFGYLGDWRFARALRALREVDRKAEPRAMGGRFEDLIHFTRSSYFWPRTGRRLRQRVIAEYAEYLLANGAENPEAQRVYLKAFLQAPEDSRYRDVLVSVLTRKPDLTPQEVDVLLLILKTEHYEDRPLLTHLASYFLDRELLTHKSEPVLRKALEFKTVKAHRITRFMLPHLLDKNRHDAPSMEFYLHALPEADPEQKKILKTVLSLGFLEERFKTVDPVLHEKCGRVFAALEPDRQAALKRQADETRLSSKWKKVRLFTAEDRRLLKSLLAQTGIVKTWGRHLGQALVWCGRASAALLKRLILKGLDGVIWFGQQPSRFKMTALGLALLTGLVAAVIIDWRTSSPLSEQQESWKDPERTGPESLAANRIYTIQVAAVTTQAKADRFVANLKRAKVQGAYILKVERKTGGYWYKIRVGSFETKSQAQAFANRMVQRKLVRNYFLIALKRPATG